MSSGGELLFAPDAYLAAIDNLLKRSEQTVELRDGFESPGEDVPIIVSGVGGSASLACFLARCFTQMGHADARLVSQDELQGVGAAVTGKAVFLITASGSHPWTLRQISHLASLGAHPYVVTLRPASSAAESVQRVSACALLAPSKDLYKDEYVASANVAALLSVISAGVLGRGSAADVVHSFHAGIVAAKTEPYERLISSASRLVILNDYAGRVAALDFICRCREVGPLSFHHLEFRDLVHGSSGLCRVRKHGDRPVTLAFVSPSLAEEVRDLFAAESAAGTLLLIPVDESPQAQGRSLGFSIGLHAELVARSTDDLTIRQWTLGTGLWRNYR